MACLALLQISSIWYAKSKEIEPTVLTIDYSEEDHLLTSAVLTNLQEENQIAWIEIKGKHFNPQYNHQMFGYVEPQIEDNYANYTYHAIRNTQFQIRDEDAAFMKQLKSGDIVTVQFNTGPEKTVPLQVFEKERREWLSMMQGGGDSETASLTTVVLAPFTLESITTADTALHVEKLVIANKTVSFPLTEPIPLQKGQRIELIMSGGMSLHRNTRIPILFSGKNELGMVVNDMFYTFTFTLPPANMVEQWVKEAKHD